MTDINQQYQQAEELMDQNQNDEATALLEKLIEEKEDYGLAHLALSILYGKKNDVEKALKHGERACELDPNEQINYISLSMLHRRAFMVDQDPNHLHAAEDAMNKQRTLAMLQQQQEQAPPAQEESSEE